MANKKFWRKFGLSFPMSASSFAGNTLACCVALATIHILQQERLIKDCEKKGRLFLNQLQDDVEKYPSILKTINGLGLLIGIETEHAKTAMGLAREMIRQNVLTVPAFGNPSVLMIEPPLIISFDQIEKVLDAFERACETLVRGE